MRVETFCRTILAALLFAFGAEAQDVSPAEAATGPAEAAAPRRIYVESLAVSGTKRKAMENIVRGQSRLVPGREYSESEIRDAVRRVRQLAFVLDAHPSLRKGTAPGRYALVLEIVEDALVVVGVRYDHDLDYGFSGSEMGVQVGFDTFFGASSRVFASLSAGDGATPRDDTAMLSDTMALLGYQKFDIVGAGSRLTLSIGTELRRYSSSQAFGASLLVARGSRETVSFGVGLSHNRFTRVESLPRVSRSIEHAVAAQAAVAWTHETADDPFAALEGTRLTVSGMVSKDLSKDTPAFLLGPDSFARVTGDVSRAVPLSRHFTLEPYGAVTCYTYPAPFRDDCRLEGGAALRYVYARRRNSQRAFLELGISVEDELRQAHHSPALRAYVAAGVRTRIAVIRFSFNGGRFQR